MGFKIIDFGKLEISKDYLKSLPKYHLNFIAASSVAATDMTVLVKQLLGFHNRDIKDTVLVHSLVLHQLTMFRIVGSKIYEYVIFFEAYIKKLERSKKTDDFELASRLANSMKAIRAQRQFSVIEKVRDDITHHYQIKNAEQALEKFPEGHKFLMFFGDKAGVSIYPAGEELCHLHMLYDSADKGPTISEMMSWIAETGGLLGRLHQSTLKHIFNQFPPNAPKWERLFIDNKHVCDVDTKLPFILFRPTQ